MNPVRNQLGAICSVYLAEVESSRPEPVTDLVWSSERAVAFADMSVSLWAELLRGLEGGLPVARHETSSEVRAAVAMEIPKEALSEEELERHFRSVMFEHSMYPGHPGFVAYISGAGTVPGAVADLLAAGLNQNTGGWRLGPAAAEIEQHLVEWFAHKLGIEGGGGFITTGGAAANMVGIQLARLSKAGWDVRESGLAGGPQLKVYSSTETHVTVDRAAEIAGLGRAGVTHIAVDSDMRMDVKLLREAIETDLAAGLRPIAVVGTAGTTGTGSIDPLEEIADVCEAYDLWFHVDAAYGGAAALTDSMRHLFSGLERADSLGFDPHKWLYTPMPGACVIVRDPRILVDAFGLHASYVVQETEKTGWGRDMAFMSPDFSRHFAAFKIWVSLLAHGWDAYQRRIAHDVELTRYLQRLVESEPELEVVSPQRLSIVTFRYVPADLAGDPEAEPHLNELNEQIMFEIEFGGRVYPSNALVDGRFAIRSCIVNFRTEAEEMEALVDETLRIGRARDATLRGTRS